MRIQEELVPLGSTGLSVSRLGLGLAALGRPGYINLGHAEDLERDYGVGTMEERTHAVLDAAWTAGVRYFDAARSYGRAEEFLATWLEGRKIEPDAAVVGSKWGYTYTADWQVQAEHHEVKQHSLENLDRQVGESLGWLAAHLDLYQIHSATLESGVLDDQAVLDRLAELRADGLTIGLTLSGPRQADTLRRALEVQFDGEPLFQMVQATWNVLEPSAGGVLAEAHRAGLGIIVKEALANGRLTPRNRDPDFAAARRLLEAEAMRLGATVDALALAAVLAQPWVDVALSGAASAEHLLSNLAALRVKLDADALARLGDIAEDPATYWRKRSQLAWN